MPTVPDLLHCVHSCDVYEVLDTHTTVNTYELGTVCSHLEKEETYPEKATCLVT